MFRFRLALLGLAAVLCGLAAVGSAADPKDEAVQKELKAFDGTWTLVGQDKVQVVISNGKYSEKQEGKEVESGTLTVDPSKTPKTMDLMILEGPHKGMMQLAVYELKGDELRIAFAKPGARQRPPDLKSEGGFTVQVLKRAR
jgi:uncharacterized protein (TIGR03067 family)